MRASSPIMINSGLENPCISLWVNLLYLRDILPFVYLWRADTADSADFLFVLHFSDTGERAVFAQ